MSWSQVERLITAYLGLINLGFALAVIVGGAVRFPPPTYRPLLNATGGHVWPYGILFLISALGLLSWSTWGRMAGAAVGILAHSTFAALFLVAAVEYPDAAATAWWAYLAFATQSATCAALIWCHHVRRRSLTGRA